MKAAHHKAWAVFDNLWLPLGTLLNDQSSEQMRGDFFARLDRMTSIERGDDEMTKTTPFDSQLADLIW